MDKISISKCSYESSTQALIEYHLFAAVLILPIAPMLLFNTDLRKFYLPLARLVDVTFISQALSTLLFFAYQPYSIEGEGICIEIFASRINTIAIMVGELHQIYLVAFALGLHDKYRVHLCANYLRMSLSTLLNISTIATVSLILLSFFYVRGSLMILEDICFFTVSVVQLRIVQVAVQAGDDHLDNSIISASDLAISIFKRLSVLQLVSSLFCFLYRVLFDICGFTMFGNVEGVLCAIDCVCTLVFYVKTLLIKDKACNVMAQFSLPK